LTSGTVEYSHRGIPDVDICGKTGLVPAVQIHGPFDRMLHQLASIPECQFFLDVRLVGLDGLHAQVKLVRNLPRSMALADQTKHF
jgi:hypothetical protein